MHTVKFRLISPSGFREEGSFIEIDQSETKFACGRPFSIQSTLSTENERMK
jgi:hypothetical protein